MLEEARADGGVTLVEVVTALALLLTVTVAVGGLLLLTRTMSARSRNHAMALWITRAKMEQLRGLTFAVHALPGGGQVLLTDVVTDVSQDPHSVGGPGLTDSPGDTIATPTMGYVDHVDAFGRWVGGGAAIPAAAAFQRRWSIRRSGVGPDERLLVDVVSLPIADATTSGPPSASSGVRMTAVRVRSSG